jgi:hypothetical protein
MGNAHEGPIEETKTQDRVSIRTAVKASRQKPVSKKPDNNVFSIP